MDDSRSDVDFNEDISRFRGSLLSSTSDAGQRRSSNPHSSVGYDEDTSSRHGRLLSSSSEVEQRLNSLHNSRSSVRYDAERSGSRERLRSSTLGIEHLHSNFRSRNASYASWASDADRSTLRGTGSGTSKIAFNVSSDDHKAFNNRRLAHRRRYWLRSWAWELSSIAFSIACIGAIITILLFTNGKPLSSWKLLISPNAVISVFNTGAESAMLLAVAGGIGQLKWIYFQRQQRRMADMEVFDEASRGPWGAVELLLRIRWRAVLASAGAGITIATLAMDPLAQQVLQYSDGPTALLNSTASLTTAHAFDLGSELTTDVSFEPTAGDTLNEGWHLGVQKVHEAIRRSIYAPEAQGSVTCPTGNCSWPQFTTLGICGSCTIVNDVKVECSDGTFRTALNNPGSVWEMKSCTYSTPNDIPLEAAFNTHANVSRSYTPVGTMLVAQSAFSTNRNGLLDTSIIRFASDYFNTRPWKAGKAEITASNAPLPDAYDCEFRWCAKIYRPTFSGSKLDDNARTAAPLAFPLDCLYDDSLQECTAYVGNGDNSTASSSQSSAQAYMISPKSAKYLRNDLQSFLNETLVSGTTSNPDASALFWANDGNITKTVDDIAQSLTNYIRQGPNSTVVNGTAWTSEPYIHVHWPWLTLPISLVMFSAVFLAVCIHRSEIVWKNSALVLLFHGFGDWDKEALHVTSLDGMVDAAEDTWVRLTEDDREQLRDANEETIQDYKTEDAAIQTNAKTLFASVQHDQESGSAILEHNGELEHQLMVGEDIHRDSRI